MDFADLIMVDIAGGIVCCCCCVLSHSSCAGVGHGQWRLTPYRGPRLLLYHSLAVSLFSTRVGRIFQIRGRHREQRAERTETAKAQPQAGETVVVVEERRHSTAQRQQQQQQQQQQWVQRTTSSAKWFLHTTSQSAQLQPSSEASSSLPWATATRRQLQLQLPQLLLQQRQTVSSTLRRPSMTSLRPPTRPKHKYHGAKTQQTLPYDLIR